MGLMRLSISVPVFGSRDSSIGFFGFVLGSYEGLGPWFGGLGLGLSAGIKASFLSEVKAQLADPVFTAETVDMSNTSIDA